MMADIPVNVNDALIVVVATSNNQADYDFDFLAYEVTHLRAIKITTSNGSAETLLAGIDFGVSGLQQAGGGSITLNDPNGILVGDKIIIYRDVPIERIADYQQSGDFRAETVNLELDLQTMMMQELRRDVNRAVMSPLGSPPIKIIVGEDGSIVKFVDGNLVPGGDISDIENAAENAELAQEHATIAIAASEHYASMVKPNRQRLAMEMDVGAIINGVNTEQFLNAQRPHQDIHMMDVGGRTKVLMTIATGGATYTSSEKVRIVQFDFSDDGSSVDPEFFTAEMELGHGQGFSGFEDDGQIYLYAPMQSTAVDQQKGISKVAWQGANTDQTNISYFQLFGNAGSGHMYENLHRAMPAVSSNGRFLAVHAEWKSKIDDAGTVLIYDRVEVETAANSLDVKPLFEWRVKNLPYVSAWVKQGIVVTDSKVRIVFSGSSPQHVKYIQEYTLNGQKVNEFFVSGMLDYYGKAGTYSNVAKGPLIQGECEGICFHNGRHYMGFVTQFLSDTPIVSATINGEVLNFAARASVPADIEITHSGYWVETGLAATHGSHNPALTYAVGTNKTEKGKFLLEIGNDPEKTDWFPVLTEWFGLHGSVMAAAGSSLDYSSPYSQAMNFGHHFQTVGEDGIGFIVASIKHNFLWLFDQSLESIDRTKQAILKKTTTATQKLTRLSTWSGGLINLWDEDDATNPGWVQLVAKVGASIGVLSVKPNGLIRCRAHEANELEINYNEVTYFEATGNTGMLMVWNGQGAAHSGAAGIIYYDVSGTANCQVISGGSALSAQTGIMGDGDGVAGDITFSAHSDGRIYVANKLGGGFKRYIAYQNFTSERV